MCGKVNKDITGKNGTNLVANPIDRTSLRIKFLENCNRAEMIPSFLKFRIPNNGCFDGKSVHEFQRQLLSKEIVRAKNDLKSQNTSLDEKRDKLKRIAPTNCLPSIVLHTRNERSRNRQTQRRTHNKISPTFQKNKKGHCLMLKTQ